MGAFIRPKLKGLHRRQFVRHGINSVAFFLALNHQLLFTSNVAYMGVTVFIGGAMLWTLNVNKQTKQQDYGVYTFRQGGDIGGTRCKVDATNATLCRTHLDSLCHGHYCRSLIRENVAYPHHGVGLYDHRRDGLSRDAYHVANDKTSESSSNAYIPIRIRMGGCDFVDGSYGDAADSRRFWSRDRSLFWDMGGTQSDSAEVVHEAT